MSRQLFTTSCDGLEVVDLFLQALGISTRKLLIASLLLIRFTYGDISVSWIQRISGPCLPFLIARAFSALRCSCTGLYFFSLGITAVRPVMTGYVDGEDGRVGRQRLYGNRQLDGER